MSGIYIHIPFCVSKCHYCGFYSRPSIGFCEQKKYLEAVLRELNERKSELEDTVKTIYIGGGTPSIIPSELFTDFMKSILSNLPNIDSNPEITIEVNPDDVTSQKIKTWKENYINRLSIGVQSFDDKELISIGRRHSSASAINAYNMLATEFENISIDLMFGLPGQTLDSWKYSVEKAVKLTPTHISAYSLMYECGTPLENALQKGEISEASESLVEDMFDLLTCTLSSAGYNHYEVSNFSLPGLYSKHNFSYWSGERYIGLGPGAHSFNGNNMRSWNPCNIEDYIGNSSSYMRKFEILTKEERFEEVVMTTLRTASGVNLDNIRKYFGEEKYNNILDKAMPLINDGMLRLGKSAPYSFQETTMPGDNYLSLTHKGVMISDFIILKLVG